MESTRRQKLAQANSPDIESLHHHVCNRIRQLRRERGWTLDALASLSGVSRSMLSQVERGQANPTLAVTFRIALAFELTLSDLVSGAFAPRGVEVIRSDDPASVFRDDDDCRIRTLSPLNLEKDVEFYEVELHPGKRLSSAAHFDGTREFITLHRGSLEITSGEFSQTLLKGDSAQYRADVDHSIFNPGKNTAVFFLVDIYASNKL